MARCSFSGRTATVSECEIRRLLRRKRGSLLVHHVFEFRDRDDLVSADQHSLAVAFDAGRYRVGDVEFARRVRVPQIVQVGVRASGRSKAHWEQTLGVRQFWADEIRARGEAVIDEVIAHLRTLGTKRVYISNDIDATDVTFAPATGAPAADGPSPEFFRALIGRVGAEFPLLGADVVEVAPPLGAPEGARRTTDVAAWSMLESLAALTGDRAFTKPEGSEERPDEAT